MNWVVFGVTAYVFFAVQSGFAVGWSVGAGVTPNLLLVLAVFVGMSARRSAVPWSLLVVGVLLDLLPGPVREQGTLVGPQAVGYLAASFVVLQLRNLLFRESVLTMVVLVFAVGGFAALVESVLYAFRGLPWLAGEPLAWGAMEQLWRRLQELVYTAAVAVPVGLLLGATRRVWGFSGRPRGERVF
ncbi:MAG: hypothetical protein AAFX76_12255 [Planctomycetota bacterium]